MLAFLRVECAASTGVEASVQQLSAETRWDSLPVVTDDGPRQVRRLSICSLLATSTPAARSVHCCTSRSNGSSE